MSSKFKFMEFKLKSVLDVEKWLLIERLTVTKSGMKRYLYKRLNVAHYSGYGISKNGKLVDRIQWCYLNAEQLKQLSALAEARLMLRCISLVRFGMVDRGLSTIHALREPLSKRPMLCSQSTSPPFGSGGSICIDR